MKRRIIYFTAPGRVEVREESIAAPADDEALVETTFSAISAGTEMLIYRGQFPRELADAYDKQSSNLSYPLAYGYACVGRVIDVGKSISRDWVGRRVFAFKPHQSHFNAKLQDLLVVPEILPSEAAVFLPNMETAVNLLQDAAPILGECALVFGQGVVGLLASALLHKFPLALLVSVDGYSMRRKASIEIGVDASFDPAIMDWKTSAVQQMTRHGEGFDLTLELSGNPVALDDAITLTRFSGRIIAGSWYGEKQAAIDLGGRFHRSRIRIISSQVSTIAPELGARWNKARRFDVAWKALSQIGPEKWITHRFPLESAADAYQLLEKSTEQTIQVIFNYQG